MVKSGFIGEAIYILLLFIQIYDKVTSANKVIMTKEANLFGTSFQYASKQYIFCMFNSRLEGICCGKSPWRKEKTTFVLLVIVAGVGKGC